MWWSQFSCWAKLGSAVRFTLLYKNEAGRISALWRFRLWSICLYEIGVIFFKNFFDIRTLFNTIMKAEDHYFPGMEGKVCDKGFYFSLHCINHWGNWLAMENGTQLLAPNMICHLILIYCLRNPRSKTLLSDKTGIPLSFLLSSFYICLEFSPDSQASIPYAFNNSIRLLQQL